MISVIQSILGHRRSRKQALSIIEAVVQSFRGARPHVHDDAATVRGNLRHLLTFREAIVREKREYGTLPADFDMGTFLTVSKDAAAEDMIVEILTRLRVPTKLNEPDRLDWSGWSAPEDLISWVRDHQ